MKPVPNPLIEDIHATRARLMSECGNDLHHVVERLRRSQEVRVHSGARMAKLKPVRPKSTPLNSLTHS